MGQKPPGKCALKYATAISPHSTKATGRVNNPRAIKMPAPEFEKTRGQKPGVVKREMPAKCPKQLLRPMAGEQQRKNNSRQGQNIVFESGHRLRPLATSSHYPFPPKVPGPPTVRFETPSMCSSDQVSWVLPFLGSRGRVLSGDALLFCHSHSACVFHRKLLVLTTRSASAK